MRIVADQLIRDSLLVEMEFPKRLAVLRKERGMTQQTVADVAGVHVVQIRRYETGVTLPTFEILKKLAIALSVSLDVLVFDKDERGPSEDLRLEFEATSRLDPEEKNIVKAIVRSLVLQHDAKHWGIAANSS